MQQPVCPSHVLTTGFVEMCADTPSIRHSLLTMADMGMAHGGSAMHMKSATNPPAGGGSSGRSSGAKALDHATMPGMDYGGMPGIDGFVPAVHRAVEDHTSRRGEGTAPLGKRMKSLDMPDEEAHVDPDRTRPNQYKRPAPRKRWCERQVRQAFTILSPSDARRALTAHACDHDKAPGALVSAP